MMELTLPSRSVKPRSNGRTHVLDRGLGVHHIEPWLDVASPYVDLVKLGWGTSVITPNLTAKLSAYRRFGLEICLGGTLLEVCYLQRRAEDYFAWLKELELTCVEVSDGVVEMPERTKIDLISRLAREFVVYSEVGCKDAEFVMTPQKWIASIRRELAAGAAYVILEGRESGTAGMYRASGEVRMGLIEEIVESGLPLNRLIFEAPQKTQQVWLTRRFGSDVNIGNVAFDDVLSLETIRLGLRGDTVKQFHA